MMKISIGPCLFEWGKRGVADFYRRMAYETEADILYIGEVVCSKRLHLGPDDLLDLAEELKKSGKEIVFSTLGLIMSEREQEELRDVAIRAKTARLRMEANDMAAVGVGEGQPLVAGPHICTYNPETLDFLMEVGVGRVVLPVELSKPQIQGILRGHEKMEAEIFAYGRLPLTFSARCYTARAFNLPKVNCQYKCGEYPDGMAMRTQDDQEFLVINGIETMSDRLYNLVCDLDAVQKIGVDIVRLSPQSQQMEAVVDIWKQRVDGRMEGAEALDKLLALNNHIPFCNGYFHQHPGLSFIQPG